ncbi:DUF202 domain-containing protein [Myceligenerans pegani]|uniref:DUF202 domain-containing protein n=1 Tax=Myceligenerans pegani TaxID=2776917 RepID=A0ABR9MWM2_9MICO|nr:DUF202 domain-containing protein [Myceligenerans sp. TRM 65318]MBE1875795.1 DUF202 domain-containing protein [Myceligenerans sp. TRM 65318]MBE3018066.1 DUF202 domain-containing protein [Myceligenerans sp. TRM 65318]
MSGPWDAGLQPERAELSWRRTVLAVTAGTVIAARYLGQSHPVFGLLLPLVALVGGLVLLRIGTLRFRRLDARLRAAGSQPSEPVMPGAAMLGLLALMCLLIGVTSTAFIVVTALRQ